MNTRAEIIGLMRGYYALPIIALIGTCGALKRMQQSAFKADDFNDLMDTNRLRSLFRYLARLELLCLVDDDRFEMTQLGRSVFKRYGSFCVVGSYEEHFRTLSRIVHENPDEYTPSVDRRLNVIGSGAMHGKKFFGTAIDMLGAEPVDVLVDVGCGDGSFAAAMAQHYPRLRFAGVDASPEALAETSQRIGSLLPIETHLSDARDVSKWTSFIKASNDDRLVISFWFLLHEIADRGIDSILDLLKQIAVRLPTAEIIVGEIIDGGIEPIASNRTQTIMPEYLLFHELSGQRPFDLVELRSLFENSPYQIRSEALIDTIEHGGQTIPSNVIFHLVPSDL